MVAYLKKPEGSEEFHQIVDFLNASHIRYAITKNPTIYVSLIKQFWQTDTARTLDNGEIELIAIIDGKVKTVTEASVRRHLKLADANGISSLPTTKISEQLSLMGYVSTSDKLTFEKGHFSPQWRFLIHAILHCLSPKKTSWEQFSSNIATAIICLATNQKFIFSKLIFDGMVKNLYSKHKFLMYPRFIQVFLNKHKRLLQPHTRLYIAPTRTQKLFSNMKRASKGYSGKNIPLFPTMIVQGPVVQGEGSTHPVESHHTPTSAPSTSQPPVSLTSRRTTRQGFVVPQPRSPTQTPVADEAASTGVDVRYGGATTTVIGLETGQGSGNIDKTPTMPCGSPLLRVNTLGSDEGNITLQELMVLCTTLSKKVEILETDLKQTKQIYGASYTKLMKKVKKLEKIVKSSQARRRTRIVVSNDEDDLKDPSKLGRKIAAIDQDPGISLVQHDVEIQGRYVHDMEFDFDFDAAKEVSTAEPVSIASASVTTASVAISTASPTINTGVSTADDISMAETLVYIRKSTVKYKGKGKIVESKTVQTNTKLQQEQARLDFKAAMRLQDELEIKTDEELAQRLQLEEREKYSEAGQARMLAELINQRKSYFAKKRAEERMNKPPIQAQQRTYMSNYIKHMGGMSKKLIKKSSKRQKDCDSLRQLKELRDKEVEISHKNRLQQRVDYSDAVESWLKRSFNSTELTDTKKRRYANDSSGVHQYLQIKEITFTSGREGVSHCQGKTLYNDVGCKALAKESILRWDQHNSRGNRYILVAVDYVSKWVEAQALPTNDARVIVKFLRQLFARFGVPKALISDRGTHFCNSQLEKALQRYGVTHKLSTAYHPQSNRQNEVTNRAIKRILERSVGYNPKGWSKKLNDALWAFRTAYKTPIGCTPFRLVYEKACHLHVEIEHKAHWALKQCNLDLTLASKSRLMQLNELAELRDDAYENTRIYKERTNKWHDSRLRGDKDFKVGDKVLLYNSRLRMYLGKLKSKWSGLNIVKTVYPHGAVEITHRDGFSFKLNGKRLKKYYGGDIDKEDDEVIELENDATRS
ncbi:reverse transcriptase domain-containing protein [Tanacetum coccineum]